jgi:hypothetical protein
MSITPQRQLLELGAFFEAVAEGISEGDRGVRPQPKPPQPAALDAPSLLDSMRAMMAEELRGHAKVAPELEGERARRIIAEERVASLETKLERNDIALQQLESERTRRAVAEERVSSLESKLELGASALQQLESERTRRDFAEERVAGLESKLELGASALQQLESERTRRAVAEERVAGLESKLELGENERRALETEVRDQNTALALLRSEFSRLNEHAQQLERAHSELRSEHTQIAATQSSRQADLDASQRERDAANAMRAELQSTIDALNARLTQAGNTHKLQENNMESVRIKFTRKLEDKEAELKRVQNVADERLQLAQQQAAAQLAQLMQAHAQALNERERAEAAALAAFEAKAQEFAKAGIDDAAQSLALSEAQAELARLQASSEAQEQAHAQAMIAHERAAEAELVESERAAEAALALLRSELKQLSEHVQEGELAHRQLQSEYAQIVAQQQARQADFDTSQRERSEALETQAELERTINSLNASLTQARDAQRLQESDIADLHREFDRKFQQQESELKQSLSAAEIRLTEAQQQFAAQLAELGEAHALALAAEAALASAKATLQAQSQEYAKSELISAVQAEALASAENELARLQALNEQQDQVCALLRSELSQISAHTQQLELAHSQLRTEYQQSIASSPSQQMHLLASQRERDEAVAAKAVLENTLKTLNLRLAQSRNEQSLQESNMDSLRIEFGRKFEENENQLKRLLLAADDRLRDVQQKSADQLTELSDAHALSLAAQANALSAAQTEIARLQSLIAAQEQGAKKRSSAAFLAELPSTPSIVVVANTVVATEPSPSLEQAPQVPQARLSAAEIEHEKHRLAVLSLGTAIAPAKLYFQLLPWQGLKTARISVAANDASESVGTLTAFAVATATQQAIDASNANISLKQAQVNS